MKVVLGVLFLLAGSFLDAQESNWKVILQGGRTISSDSWMIVGDSVVLRTAGSDYTISIDSIAQLHAVKETKIGKGLLFGLLGGALVGGVIGLASYKEPSPSDNEGLGNWDFGRGPVILAGALVGSLAGLAVGGVVGAAVGSDETYDFTKITRDEKLRLLAGLTQGNIIEWRVMEISLSDVMEESNSEIELRIDGKPVVWKKSDVRIIRRTDHSLILALPSQPVDDSSDE